MPNYSPKGTCPYGKGRGEQAGLHDAAQELGHFRIGRLWKPAEYVPGTIVCFSDPELRTISLPQLADGPITDAGDDDLVIMVNTSPDDACVYSKRTKDKIHLRSKFLQRYPHLHMILKPAPTTLPIRQRQLGPRRTKPAISGIAGIVMGFGTVGAVLQGGLIAGCNELGGEVAVSGLFIVLTICPILYAGRAAGSSAAAARR